MTEEDKHSLTAQFLLLLEEPPKTGSFYRSFGKNFNLMMLDWTPDDSIGDMCKGFTSMFDHPLPVKETPTPEKMHIWVKRFFALYPYFKNRSMLLQAQKKALFDTE